MLPVPGIRALPEFCVETLKLQSQMTAPLQSPAKVGKAFIYCFNACTGWGWGEGVPGRGDQGPALQRVSHQHYTVGPTCECYKGPDTL